MTVRLLITPAEACRAWEEIGTDLQVDGEVILTHGQVDDRERLAELLADVDGVVLGLERIDESLLERAPRLRVISRFGVGYDAIDLEALRARGVRLTNTPGSMAPAVARQALAFLLAITFNLPEHGRALAVGDWLRFPNQSCFATTLGVVGLGAVGLETAKLAQGIGYRVAAFSRTSRAIPGIETVESLEALIERADVVSLHIALTPQTRGLISARTLELLRGRSLINTARGALVEEEEVLRALESGLLRYYATDVFCREPVAGVSAALCRHPRVIATPHVAAMDAVTANAMLRQAIASVLHTLAGDHAAVSAYVV